MYAIEIKNLTKSYKDVTAVDGLTLSVEGGKLTSILGVNGAGKTTTIKMLTGLTRPTSGDALVLGKSIMKDAAEIKKEINISTQETAVAENLTVRENLMLIAGIYGFSGAEALKACEETINALDMKKVENKRAKLLSGGWQRRLSIAMALITKPKIVFLDEPTLGLDVLARRELWKVIESLKGSVTVILTTHYMEEAEELSDSIAVMAEGKLLAHGTVEELKAATGKGNLEEAFVALAEGSAK